MLKAVTTQKWYEGQDLQCRYSTELWDRPGGINVALKLAAGQTWIKVRLCRVETKKGTHETPPSLLLHAWSDRSIQIWARMKRRVRLAGRERLKHRGLNENPPPAALKLSPSNTRGFHVKRTAVCQMALLKRYTIHAMSGGLVKSWTAHTIC